MCGKSLTPHTANLGATDLSLLRRSPATRIASHLLIAGSIAILAISLTGCFRTTVGDIYRQTQASVRPDATLDDFIGTYEFRAAQSDMRASEPTIRLLLGPIWPNDHFKIYFDEQGGLVFFGAPLPQDGIERNFPFPLTYTPDEYTLRDGWLHLPIFEHFGEAAWVSFGRDETRFALGLDPEGNLMVRTEFDVAGLSIFPPFVFKVLKQEASVFRRLSNP